MLVIEHLQKTYHPEASPALADISLAIGQGEFVAVLGLSGAGKSTLIRCINRLVEPTDGKIFWNGTDVLSLRGKALRQYRKRIGFVFQSFNLIERLDVLTNVLAGHLAEMPLWRAALFRFAEAEKRNAMEALERVGLRELAKRRVTQLSGGQRQRVAIARALMQSPQLILGDEPVSSLDPVTADSVMNLLRQINEEDRITMLINLHDVTLAKRYAKRIIGIARGRIVFDGTPEQLTETEIRAIYGQLANEPPRTVG